MHNHFYDNVFHGRKSMFIFCDCSCTLFSLSCLCTSRARKGISLFFPLTFEMCRAISKMPTNVKCEKNSIHRNGEKKEIRRKIEFVNKPPPHYMWNIHIFYFFVLTSIFFLFRFLFFIRLMFVYVIYIDDVDWNHVLFWSCCLSAWIVSKYLWNEWMSFI